MQKFDFGAKYSYKFLTFVMIVAVVNTTAMAAPQQNGQAGDAKLADMIAQRDQAHADRGKKTANTVGIVAGIGAALLCGAADKKNSDAKKGLCALAGVAVYYATSMLGKAIAKKLVEKDQQKVLVAASDSLRTGEPKTLALPDSTATASVTPSGQAVNREATVDIFYDTVRLANLSKVEVIAQPYVITKAKTALRAQPDDKSKIVGTFGANHPLYVTGQVVGTPWYMVSERVTEGPDSAMMAIGYIDSRQLKAAAQETTLPGHALPATIQKGELTAILKCDRVTFQVVDAKGKPTKQDSVLCIGPEGQSIPAAA